MEPALDPDQQRRASCLPWMFGGLFVSFLALLLIVATGGYFFTFLVVIGLGGMIFWMQYALWGRGLDESVEWEREENEAGTMPPQRHDGAKDERIRKDRH